MKITANNTEDNRGSFYVNYSKFPMDGVGQARAVQWESGDGWDITIAGSTLELTHFELTTLQYILAKIQYLAFAKDDEWAGK